MISPAGSRWFVCLSVCKITKNACMDLDEMLCRQMSGHGRTD